MKKSILLSTLFLVFIFISCNGTKKVAENTQSVILSGKYEIKSIQGEVLKSKLFISFDASENKINGKTDCNGFGGVYTLDKNKINFEPIIATKMYCEEHVMKVERSFFEALHKATTFTFDNNMLTLISEENGGVVLKAYKYNKEEDK